VPGATLLDLGQCRRAGVGLDDVPHAHTGVGAAHPRIAFDPPLDPHPAAGLAQLLPQSEARLTQVTCGIRTCGRVTPAYAAAAVGVLVADCSAPTGSAVAGSVSSPGTAAPGRTRMVTVDPRWHRSPSRSRDAPDRVPGGRR